MALKPTAHLRQKKHLTWNTYHLQQWWYDSKNKKGKWKSIEQVPSDAPDDVANYNQKLKR